LVERARVEATASEVATRSAINTTPVCPKVSRLGRGYFGASKRKHRDLERLRCGTVTWNSSGKTTLDSHHCRRG
jgi:hypothetical protein